MNLLPQVINLPTRNILDVIDPVAADHTADVKQAFVDYEHWHIPPDTTVKLNHGLWASGDAISIPDDGSLIGQNGDTSVVQILDDPASASGKSVFGLLGPLPRQRIENLTFLGAATTPMTWTNGQTTIFYENMGSAGGGQSVIRSEAIRFDRCRFQAYAGFPIHSEYARIVATFCTFIDCGNGFNCNGAGNYIERCYFERAEGIEMSGVGTTAINNIFVDALNVALSIGGYFNAGHPEYHSGYIAGNRIYGCSGGGIIIAESMTDVEIVGNYIEDCTTYGIQALDQGSYLSNGVLVQGNHVVSCSTVGLSITQDNARVIGNRVYNRADLAHSSTLCLTLGGDRQIADGNLLDASVGTGTYAVDFNGCTNLTWGPSNHLVAGGSGVMQLRNSPTFRDARHLSYATRTITTATTVLPYERTLILDANGANRTINIPTAVGRTGKRLSFKKIDAAAFTHTIDPNGAETIDGAATKVMSSQYAFLEIESDGANWHTVASLGTIT